MTQNQNIIGLHSRSADVREIHPSASGGDHLVRMLGKAGFEAVFIPRDNYSFPDGDTPMATTYRTYSAVGNSGLIIAERPEVLALGHAPGEIQVVRTRVAAPKRLDDLIPVVNGRGLRRFGADKGWQYSVLEEYMPPTVLATDDDQVNDVLVGSIPTDSTGLVVVKGVMGQDRRWINVVDRSQAVGAINTMRAEMIQLGNTNTGVIVQAYQPGTTFDMLKGLAQADRDYLKEIPSNAQTELRMYCFVSQHTSGLWLGIFGVYRIYPGQENEQFVPIDQDSIPAEARQLAVSAVEEIMRACPTRGAMIAIDEFCHSDNGERHLGIREVNTRDPILAELVSDNPDFQRQQIEHLAQLLVQLAGDYDSGMSQI